eukprot:TRINITY_DN20447_c0_g1_i1.p1 TRINITY_DN20447_c0_g1~~TRINITY_DN20447_c0_g1_i1.p1  ORF type:complete len:322 (+),score=110.06 TRINITY_DN20447_c0_g1_i1:123-1088(+)
MQTHGSNLTAPSDAWCIFAAAAEDASWFERASDLEFRIAALTEALRQGNGQVAALKAQLKGVTDGQRNAAALPPRLGRAQRILRSQLEAAQKRTRSEVARQRKHEKDNEGLRRTLVRLEEWIQSRSGAANRCRGDTELAEDAAEADCVQEESLVKTVEGMRDAQKLGEERVGLEKEKYMQLKVCVEAKFEELEAEDEELRTIAAAHDERWLEMKAVVESHEEEAQAALAKLTHIADVRAAKVEELQQQVDARRSMHGELVELKQTHERLRAQLDTIASQFDHMAAQDRAVREDWQQRQIQAWDRRWETRRAMDKDIPVGTR